MRYVGDVHGQMQRYLEIIRTAPASIQVGDFGLGFESEWDRNPKDVLAAMEDGDHLMGRGNHDHPEACVKFRRWIPDGSYIENRDTFVVGGAASSDRSTRTSQRIAGWDWWPDEEVSYSKMDAIKATYLRQRPRIMVTHDGPHEMLMQMFGRGTHKPINATRTGVFLQELWEAHQPDLWVFGHWHVTRTEVASGTDFRCLGALDFLDTD